MVSAISTVYRYVNCQYLPVRPDLIYLRTTGVNEVRVKTGGAFIFAILYPASIIALV